MARATTDCHAEAQPRRDGGARTVRIDDATFEALSMTSDATSENRARIVRWLGTWAGVDR
ncbi:hypothetical protein SAMN05216559_1476 [Halomicrobium zhouii]|uniref:Uncharacterized protein n=1 Tax=Halomicrobium zhouii TaxID=767519 RepID=A0A1I6KSJ9_9EURY|nr:hypothetical protein [Halomicrobium zhouii]SFR94223.1 hypothetical protein SAMN05216559_1476 [Halomicrobium zhouii]